MAMSTHCEAGSDASSLKKYPDRWEVVTPNGRRCPHTGQSHAGLYRLLGPRGLALRYVRVAQLRREGCSRGQLLFHVGDMMRWLDAQAAARRAEMGADDV